MRESEIEHQFVPSIKSMPEGDDDLDTWYANRRRRGFTYISRMFDAPFGGDAGRPSRYVYRILVDDGSVGVESGFNEGSCIQEELGVIRVLKKKSVRLHLVRAEGMVRELVVYEVPNDDKKSLKRLLSLNREEAYEFISLLKGIEGIDPSDGLLPHRIDDELLQGILESESVLEQLYVEDAERLRELIQADVEARDVIALERRRAAVNQMESWIADDDEFAKAEELAGGKEKAWQAFFEENPWVLGVGLGGQLLTSFVEGKLEQTVSGSDFTTEGRRVDALLKSAGLINSLVFAEIKHHKTKCLQRSAYRTGIWAPSSELSGAVAQAQETVRATIKVQPSVLNGAGLDGGSVGEESYLYHPRSFVVCGSLTEFEDNFGTIDKNRFRSFESFRRNTRHPEILTFDEVLERARWAVKLASDSV